MAQSNTEQCLQSYMGSPPRTTHHNSIWSCFLSRELQIPRLPQYLPILFRRSRRLCLPSRNLQRAIRPPHIPQPSNIRPSLRRRHYQCTGKSIRIRKSRSHRLHILHPRQILQTSPRHVPTHSHIPKTLPGLQIPGRARCNPRRGSLHHAPRRGKTQALQIRPQP